MPELNRLRSHKKREKEQHRFPSLVQLNWKSTSPLVETEKSGGTTNINGSKLTQIFKGRSKPYMGKYTEPL